MTTDLVDQKQFDKFLTLTVPKNVRCLATGTYSREIVGADVSKGDAVMRYRELLDHMKALSKATGIDYTTRRYMWKVEY